jgi:hypothetical protein
MANETTFAALSDVTVSAALHAELALKLADRADVMGHPSLAYIGSITGSGSNVRKGPIWGGGADQMAAVADGVAATNTAVSNGSVSVTVARQALQRSATDLAAMTWAFANPAALVQQLATDMVTAARMRFTSIITALAGGFTATAGATTVDFSVTNQFTAMGILQLASAPGPFVEFLHPIQLNDLQTSLRAETGALQFIPATPEMMAIKGQGYAGRFLNIDIYVSSTVPSATAGADRAGGLMSYGAIAWADGVPGIVTGAGGLVIPVDAAAKIYVELQRDASGAMTKVVGNHFVGAAIAQQGLGVSIITDHE